MLYFELLIIYQLIGVDILFSFIFIMFLIKKALDILNCIKLVFKYNLKTCSLRFYIKKSNKIYFIKPRLTHLIFHISMSFPFQLLKVAVHVHRLTLPHFSLVKCRYPQERNMNWTHLQPYMPTKHTHLHNHIIAISRQSYICHIPHGLHLSLSSSLSLSLSLSLSFRLSIYVHNFQSCQNFSVKETVVCQLFEWADISFGGDFVLMVHAVHFI